MRGLSTIDLVEAHFGEELTESLVTQLSALPIDHFLGLEDRLAQEHSRWSTQAEDALESGKSCVDADSLILMRPSRKLLARAMLYSENVCVLDPFDSLTKADYFSDSADWRIDSGIDELGGQNEERLRRFWIEGLFRLAELRPVLLSDPTVCLVSANVNDDETLKIVRALDESLDPLGDAPDSVFDGAGTMWEAHEWALRKTQRVAFALRNDLVMCANDAELDWTLASLPQPHFTGLPKTPSQRRALSLIQSFDLPSADNATLLDLLSVRLNEEVFTEFRKTLTGVLASTHEAFDSLEREYMRAPDQALAGEVRREYGLRLFNHLTPTVRQLRSSVNTNALEKFFLPVGVTFSVGIAGFYLLADQAEKTLIASGGAMALAALEAIRRRYTPSGQRNKSLLRAYVGLLSASE